MLAIRPRDYNAVHIQKAVTVTVYMRSGYQPTTRATRKFVIATKEVLC